MHCVRIVFKEEGMLGLYRGFAGTTLKQAGATAFRMGTYNILKDYERSRNIPQSTLTNFANGSVAGIVTTLATQPFDTIKTRCQSSRGASTVEAFKSIVADYGVRGFWKGTTMRLGRTVFSGGILFTSYEWAAALLQPLVVPKQEHGANGGDPYRAKELPGSSHSQPAANLSQRVSPEEQNHFEVIERTSKEKQARSPWMRDGSDKPPVATMRSAGAMTKGKLLTTPSRMLKLILPLTTRDRNHDRKDVEPLALLVHPQQPLSYLERLIQSELPMLEDKGKERSPHIIFRAQDSAEEDIGTGRAAAQNVKDTEDLPEEQYNFEQADETIVDGKRERTGKLSSRSAKAADASLPLHGHPEPQP
ncbi:hypothetical protein KC318_g19582, partial [Hortaea werneckii]